MAHVQRRSIIAGLLVLVFLSPAAAAPPSADIEMFTREGCPLLRGGPRVPRGSAAVVTLSRHKLQERAGRWLKMVSGGVMLALGAVLIVRPAWLVW